MYILKKLIILNISHDLKPSFETGQVVNLPVTIS